MIVTSFNQPVLQKDIIPEAKSSNTSINCMKMKGVNAASTDSTGPLVGNESDGSRRGGGGGTAAAHRPTPSPPSAVAASTASSSNAIEAKPALKAAVEIVAKSESKGDDIVRNDDGGSYQSFSITATPTLPSSTKKISTMPMSLQQSEAEGRPVSYQPTKFTPIRPAYAIASQSTSRGSSGNSIVATPGPTTSRSMDMNLFGQEMLAASASTSAMMDRYGYENFSLNGESTAMMTPVPPLGETNTTFHYPAHQDDYALPPFLQAHLDETYAASSSSNSMVLPPLSATDIGNGQEEEILLQLTSFLPNLTPGAASTPFKVTALGTAPPNPTGRRVAVNNGNVHTTGSSSNINQSRVAKTATSIPAKTSAIFTSTSVTKNRPARSLPLRKRPLREEDEPEMKTVDTDQIVGLENKAEKKSSNRPRGPSTKKPSVKKPSVKKPTLVRHNYNENRSTCKCAKSRCLKLYCDCFQSGRMCNPEECGCKSCMNLDKYSGPRGARTLAINECLERNPKAFEKRQKASDEGCRCKKNKCLKKYCVCFNAGLNCNELCECRDCKNQEAEEDNIVTTGEVTETADIIGQEGKSEVIVDAPPTKYVKVASMMGDHQPTPSPFTDSSESFDSSLPIPDSLPVPEEYYGLTQNVDPQLTAEV